MMPKRERLTDERLEAIVAKEIVASQQYDKSELATKRRQAIEYVAGKMTDWPAEKNRSSVVDMTTQDTLSWILPSVMRLFTASDQMAIAEPVEQSDEKWADQATLGINHAFWKENEGYRILYNASYNSLLHGNGIVKHWWDDRPKVKISFHSGLDEDAFTDLITPENTGTDEDGTAKEEIEVLADELCEYTLEPGDEGYMASQQATDEPQEAMGVLGQAMPGEMPPAEPQPQVVMLHDCKIKRTTRFGKVGLLSIAPEDFLISSEATEIKGARLTGHKQQKTRSELIEMGFDYDKVMGLTIDNKDDETDLARDEDNTDKSASQPIDNREMEEVTLYELYLKIDVDGDGIAETIQVFFSGFGNVGTLLEWVVWEDEDVFSDVPCYAVPHRWNADSVFDKTKDIQEIKTVLSRQALDNMYGSNNPQRVVKGLCKNPDELTNPSFGGAIMMDDGGDVVNLEIPFFAEHALKGIEYFDTVLEKRTGVSRTTMALDPEALQNQTATASQLAHDAGYSQIELITRNQSELGWKSVFKAVLRLMIRHQRRKSTIRLTNKQWADIDPRYWNADMDITINTGLGSGSRDRDLAVVSSVQSDQVAFAQILREAKMPGRALEMVPMIATALRKKAEAAGIRSVDEFYPEITPQDIQAAGQEIQKANQAPPPELQIKQAEIAAQGQLKQQELAAEAEANKQKMALDTVTERMKSEAQVIREKAQLEADLMTKEKDRQSDLELESMKQAFAASEKEKDRQLQLQLKQMEISAQAQAQANQLANDNQQSDKQMAVDNQNKQADREHASTIEDKRAAAKPRASGGKHG